MKEIKIAEHSGFCFGVKRAIDMTLESAEKWKDSRKVYTYGPLIHNKIVTDDLKKSGIEIIENMEEATQSQVIIVRSHGQGKDFYDNAKKRGLTLVDATCPFVSKIHSLVEEAFQKQKKIIIIGDRNHPEVQGINGWCNDEAIIINTEEEAKNIPTGAYFAVGQTTLQKSHFDKLITILKENNCDLEIHNTICQATTLRQASCENLARVSDLMLIFGDRNSSNTKKLYNLAKKTCEKVYFIENIEDLPLKEISLCNKIGVAAGASTPERLIKEVITNMSELITENNEKNLMHDLMDEIEKSLRLPRGGEIVDGTVIQVTDREVIVNLGCKKDGIIPYDEIALEGGQKVKDLFKEGDAIQAKVLKTDDGDGNILLSKKKLEVNEHWDEINSALEDKSLVNVKVVKEVRGGVIASYKEVFGFIPLSQLSDKFVDKAEEFIGKTLPVRVSRVDQRRGKVVFSHKAFLTEERQKKVDEVWNSLSEGDVVEGTVMRFTDYGAFVDIGGIDGLLHISEISWGKLKHPQEVLTIGQKVEVKVLSMNNEKGKISLGLKQTQPEPWSIIDEKYEVGQIVKGDIVQIKEYGVFVELEPGLDGLVHISEIAHGRVTNIADVLTVGQEVSAKILEIDRERKRISLSIKETLDAPEAEETEAEVEAE